MKVFLDASIIVEIDRKNQAVIDIMKTLIDGDHEVLVSAITLSEILTGSYLRRDFQKAVETAKKILGQFIWIDFNGDSRKDLPISCISYHRRRDDRVSGRCNSRHGENIKRRLFFNTGQKAF